MSRVGMHRRDARRAVVLGVGLSLAAHAAAFAFVRMEVTPFERKADALRVETAILPTPFPEAPELVVLDLTSPAPAVESAAASFLAGGAAGGGPAAPAASATTPAVAAAPMQPVVSADERTYDPLLVVKPVRAVAAAVSFDELAVAETTPPAAEETEVAVYVPGSIGKAKRGWASSGEAAGRAGDGAGWSFGGAAGRGDGHCPMPDRGGRMPPPRHPGTVLR